jgi:hypothetical protein
LAQIVDRKDHPFHEVERFVTDRMRGIRTDISVQALKDMSVIPLYETIARWHCVARYELSEAVIDVFNPVQNNEKLTQTMISLRHCYDDNRKSAQPFATPNEPELMGYYFLFQLDSISNFLSIYNNSAREIQQWSSVQFALQVYQAQKERNYVAFFNLLRKATYLQGCLMHKHVDKMRAQALLVTAFSSLCHP